MASCARPADPATSTSGAAVRWLRQARSRTLLLIAAIFAASATVWPLSPILAGSGRAVFPASHLAWWQLAPAFLLTEMFVLHVQVKREARTLSLSELPLVLGLFFATPAQLLTARLVGTVAVYVLWRRQHPLKVAFNTATLLIEVAVAVLLFRGLFPAGGGIGLSAWAAAVFAAAASNAVTSVLVTAVIACNEDTARLREIPKSAASSAAVAGAVSVCGLLAVDAVAFQRSAVLLVVLLVGFLVAGYRAYAALSQRHLSLERLYRFTHVVGSFPETDEVLRTLLAQAQELLRSETAEVVFLPSADADDDDLGVRVTLGGTGRLARREMLSDDGDGPILRALFNGAPAVLAARNTRTEAHREWLHARGYREAVAAPLRGEAGVTGVLIVANRLGDIASFETEDIRLLETVANHASVALENGRLVEQLRHEALHDAMTGLPNRLMLQRRLREELVRLHAGNSPAFAVMLLDLDGFKDVNDTFGHEYGDELLREVALRLRSALPSSDFVGRLGGDEFALLVSGVSSETAAVDVGERLLHALEEPIHVDGTPLQVSGSFGVALAPAHGAEANALLKRADMAMYAAKTAGRGVMLYAPALDTSSPLRVTLVGELRTALTETDQLVVHYQPKADVVTGEIVGVEALVRWQHPTAGMVGPDVFVPVAERSGLIRPLTTVVLRNALDAIVSLRDAGYPLGVAVNLSPRSLLDLEIVEEVAHLLGVQQLPPETLTLEITESSVMSDPDRSIQVLHQLRKLGVRLAVDDFGTGYSSLSYLRQLPVQEVKIDRSFVQHMVTEPDDATIVRSIIDLGANLDLAAVAEGVEDQETWTALAEMGCAQLQGYHLSRPLPLDKLHDWLSKRDAQRCAPLGALVPHPRAHLDASTSARRR